MRATPLILDTVRSLYLSGMDHRQIEAEMRAIGCLTFNRRILYNQKTKTGCRKGWIDKYGWRKELAQSANFSSSVSPTGTNNIAQGKADEVGRNPGNADNDHPLPEGEQQTNPTPPTDDSQPPTAFEAFLKQVSPTMTWHWPYQKLIYEQLDRITKGECKRLMIFLPPRHGKSELVTNRYAAWRLKQDPKMNIIIGSYNQRLANRFSRKVRITWEDSFLHDKADQTAETQSQRSTGIQGIKEIEKRSLSSPSSLSDPSSSDSQPTFTRSSRARLNTVSEWETGLGGGVRAVGVGGGITGFGADLVIIDDPIKSRAEAESKTYRERVWDWFNDDLYTRLEPNASIILIQTRWHEDDLAGRLLREASEEGGEHWDVISLPALAEERSTGIQGIEGMKGMENKSLASPSSLLNPSSDPLNREPGEALCPDRFTSDDLLRIKRKLGSYSFSALYQQRPTPPEGGLFKRSWFTRIVSKPPENLRWARGYDLAVSTKESADFTASFRCALDKQTGDLYIADGFRKRIEFPEQKRYITEKIRTERNTEHGIELALHGMAFIQELRREHRLFGRAFRGIKIKGDKFARALSWANLAEEGKVVLVRGPWIDAFLEEITTFPNSSHDDQLDAVSIAVEMLERRKHVAYGF